MSSGTLLMPRQVFEAFRVQIGVLVERGIQVRDVGLMMLRVVNFHRARVDMRLECVV